MASPASQEVNIRKFKQLPEEEQADFIDSMLAFISEIIRIKNSAQRPANIIQLPPQHNRWN